ncbi:SRPBCC family protein [Dactylosporangium sp. NPDC048998]|uniref:SRPBCC family protein n=1 Tax=Dactylosporangium sp. NPDC048998 TaxID=3363976 RepID=UPI00371DFDD7
MTQTIEAIRREIVVGVGRERAFEIFTADMTSWWPSAHHIGSAPIERVMIEPRVGGRWYTVHQDGSETYTGVVTVWDPPERLVVTWQIGSDWKYHTDLVTTVDVRFTEDAPGRTRVRLEHRDLEAFGADAAAMRETFEQPGAWTATLDAYARGIGEAA